MLACAPHCEQGLHPAKLRMTARRMPPFSLACHCRTRCACNAPPHTAAARPCHRTCTANCLVSAVRREVRSRRFSMSASVRSSLSFSSSAWRQGWEVAGVAGMSEAGAGKST